MEHSVVCIPSLLYTFSLSSTKKHQNLQDNHDRTAFWDTYFANGIESVHICSFLFSAVLVALCQSLQGFYNSLTLVLNSNDGLPVVDHKSSASKPYSVSSLITGLSVYPRVVGTESNASFGDWWMGYDGGRLDVSSV